MIEKVCGIYQIRNRLSGLVYIGSSWNTRLRITVHVWNLNTGRHANKHLLAAWRKDGPDNFEFSVVEVVPRRSDLVTREQHWLDSTRCAERGMGYNFRPNAQSALGVAMSDETKAKIRLAKRFISAETRAKLVAANRRRPAEYGQRTAERNRQRIWSDEAKEKISKSHRGKPLSVEHREKVGAAFRGKKLSPEHREKIRQANLRRSPELNARIAAARAAVYQRAV